MTRHHNIISATSASLTHHCPGASQTLSVAQRGERARTLSENVADHATRDSEGTICNRPRIIVTPNKRPQVAQQGRTLATGLHLR